MGRPANLLYNSVAPDSSSIYDSSSALQGLGYYQDDRYSYGEIPLDTSSDPAASLYGDASKVIAFELYDIDSGTLSADTCRLELVDSITGECWFRMWRKTSGRALTAYMAPKPVRSSIPTKGTQKAKRQQALWKAS